MPDPTTPDSLQAMAEEVLEKHAKSSVVYKGDPNTCICLHCRLARGVKEAARPLEVEKIVVDGRPYEREDIRDTRSQLTAATEHLAEVDAALDSVTKCVAEDRGDRIRDAFEHSNLVRDAVIFDHEKAEQSSRAQAVYWMGNAHLATERAEAAESANEVMRSTMHAAAEEIEQHWDAHCDEEGFGPVNLHRRLKEGNSTGGCYPAFCASGKAFTEALASAEADVRRLNWLEHCNAGDVLYAMPVQDPKDGTWWIYSDEAKDDVCGQPTLRAAIDSARGKEEGDG